jgi:predicted AlkP superfamily phosphohydrolase/phosphomutase
MYVQFDEVVGQLMAQLPASVPVMLLSDHGFAPLRRQINLNTLLYEQGFLNFYGEPDTSMSLITQADWDQTEAYALGLNGIYLNQLGREGNGIVPSQRRDEVLGRIRDGLLAYKDPENGESPFARVFITSEIYKGANLKLGPDIIVGCKSPYGLDYSAATGGIAEKGVIPNTSRWSGDHIIDPHMVPAMLMTNFKRSDKTPVIWDLAPTILTLFGQVPPEIMRGKSVV